MRWIPVGIVLSTSCNPEMASGFFCLTLIRITEETEVFPDRYTIKYRKRMLKSRGLLVRISMLLKKLTAGK